MAKGCAVALGRLLLAPLLWLSATAQAVILTEDTARYEAATSMMWLADPNQQHSPASAMERMQGGGGHPVDTRYPSFGFQQGALWFLLPVTNHSHQPFWFLRTGRPHLDYLDIYLIDEQGKTVDQQRMGDRVPFLQRNFPHYHLVTLLSFPENTTRYLLMRAQGDNVIDMPLTLSSPAAFNYQDNQLSLFYGLYYGAIVAMCLFNFLIFLSIRDSSYLLYVLYLGVFGLNLFTREGLGYQWLWPQGTLWNHYSLPILNLLTLSFSMLFTTQFLQLKTRAPGIHKCILISAIGLMVLMPLSLLNFHLAIRATTAIIFPWPLAAIALALWLIIKGYSPARYFLLAFMVIGVSTLLYILKAFQVIDGGWMLENAMQLGTFLEAVLLSFALAHRMTVLKKENLRIQREANEALERRVDERTRELNAALNARSEFLAVMSHEIRTPLNGIIGTVDMLKDTPLNREQQYNLDIIAQSGNSLLNLINDILDYSRIEAGKMPIEQTPFPLDSLLQDCVALFQQKARGNANRLSVRLADNLGRMCLGDPVRLRQILVNLISNAVKFTENGHITVLAERPAHNPDLVLFDVHDNGIGISPAQLDTLFDHFQQGDSSTSRRYGGTGLGLAICKQLVNAMGGEIGVSSEKGKGSRFWFHLPLPACPEAESPPQSQTPRARRAQPGSCGRLLIVDDNPVNLTVAKGLCGKLGYNTETAEGGLEAIAILLSANAPFDLVLMDCEMPGMDGFETARAILKLQHEARLPSFPIVALTAHAAPEKIQACHAAGMAGHLAKPINTERLQHALQQILGATGTP